MCFCAAKMHTVALGVLYQAQEKVHVSRVETHLPPSKAEFLVDYIVQQRGHGSSKLLAEQIAMSVQTLDLVLEWHITLKSWLAAACALCGSSDGSRHLYNSRD